MIEHITLCLHLVMCLKIKKNLLTGNVLENQEKSNTFQEFLQYAICYALVKNHSVTTSSPRFNATRPNEAVVPAASLGFHQSARDA